MISACLRLNRPIDKTSSSNQYIAIFIVIFFDRSSRERSLSFVCVIFDRNFFTCGARGLFMRAALDSSLACRNLRGSPLHVVLDLFRACPICDDLCYAWLTNSIAKPQSIHVFTSLVYFACAENFNFSHTYLIRTHIFHSRADFNWLPFPGPLPQFPRGSLLKRVAFNRARLTRASFFDFRTDLIL